MSAMSKKKAKPNLQSRFRVGDRVEYYKAASYPGSSVLNGYRGYVIYVDGTACGVTVQFDDPVPDSVIEKRNGRIQRNCWFCCDTSLRLITIRPRLVKAAGRTN